MTIASQLVRFRRRGSVLLCFVVLSLLPPAVHAQSWVSTATKAMGPSLKNATQLGLLAPNTSLHIVVGLQMQNADQVQPTLLRMLTPGDALFGTSLTVDQFVAQFGPTAAQVQAVQNYLAGFGFSNIQVEPNQLLVQADATAIQAEMAFNTSLAAFSQNGITSFANVLDAQVPSSLSGAVLAVLGLNNLSALRSDIRSTVPCTPPGCPIPAVANETYTPQQYQIAYDAACPSDNPTCQALNFPTGGSTPVGIIAEGNLTQVVKDLRAFETANNLPQVPVTVVNAGLASPDTANAVEWDLDSQSSTGIAQQVSRLYFYVATSLTDSDIALAINRAVEDNKVKAFNMSFGECEFFAFLDGAMLVDDEAFAEAALQGTTPFASTGDQGSACPVVPTNGVPLSGPPDVAYPAASPYVIAVGGTNLFSNADYTYNSETAWESGGGGPSYFETAPFWQNFTGSGTAPIVPTAPVGLAGRGVPDVSMCAGGAFLAICSAIVYNNGTTSLVGGTSLSSPLAMGSWARIESAHHNKLGFAGPLIYQLANGAPTLSSPYFNDVILGSNGFFSALPGWDYTTGLGTFDIFVVSKKIPSTYPH
ncbi:MAG TPA: S53 family peptidase [Bryobacteraceae bacterium]|nr:S53 family peptidase [Bryobacteraceae bacterium]